MLNILLILEGNEEQRLYNIAKICGFSEKFNVKSVNAEGFGNIPFLYQYYLSDDYYDLILCIYDVDNRIKDQNSPYNHVRKGLNDILLDDEKVNSASFCTNPNIIQFFLLGADKLENVKLTSTFKSINSKILHKYWDEIGRNKDYDASEWQLKVIEDSYKYGKYSYLTLLENAEELPLDYKTNLPGSNLWPLLKALNNGDEKYIKSLIDKGDKNYVNYRRKKQS